MFRSLTCWGYFLYMTWDKNSKLFFSKGISSFPRTICWKTDLSLLNGIDTLLDIFDHIYKFTFSVLFLFFNIDLSVSLSIPLSVCLPLWQYHNLFWVQQILSKSHDQIMWVLQLCSFSGLFVYLQSFKVLNSGFFFFCFLKKIFELERIALNIQCGLLLMVFTS